MSKTAPRDRFYCNAGSRFAEKHAIRIDDNGHKTLVKTGEKTDIYSKIQSHVDECDIERLLTQAEVEGYEILNRREVLTGDVTVVPKSLLEAQIYLQDRENEFNQLPIDIRRNFNFNFNEYIAEAGKDVKTWADKMGYKPEVQLFPTKEAEPIKEGDEE